MTISISPVIDIRGGFQDHRGGRGGHVDPDIGPPIDIDDVGVVLLECEAGSRGSHDGATRPPCRGGGAADHDVNDVTIAGESMKCPWD